jgi:hypothetical protein
MLLDLDLDLAGDHVRPCRDGIRADQAPGEVA